MAGSSGHVSHGRPTGSVVAADPEPGGPGPAGGDPCAALNVVTILQSPRPAVVTTLTVGMRLEVRPDAASPAIVAVAPGGQVAGAVVPPDIDALADCLAAGRPSVATVLRVSGGMVEVRVQPG